MKRKLRENKGITLVALVITIIVLLILAGVAIATFTGRNNTVIQAQRARDNHNAALQNEEAILDEYVSLLNEIGNTKPSQVITDDLIPTAEELEDAHEYSNSSFAFAEDGESATITYFTQQHVLLCKIEGKIYDWVASEEIAASVGAEAFRWYKEESGVLEPGTPPITASSFSTVYSESYLARVLASL